MKKFWAVILILVYTAGTAGATINRHYCMGRVSGWNFGQTSGANCDFCGMEKTTGTANGCCKDEVSFFKTVSDHQAVSSLQKPTHQFEASFFYRPWIYRVVSIPPVHCNLSTTQPPPKDGFHLCILHCIFRK